MSEPIVITRDELPNGVSIEQLQNQKGDTYYRICSPGGAVCRYCEDYWQATIYANHFDHFSP